jgi:hypothetical protein
MGGTPSSACLETIKRLAGENQAELGRSCAALHHSFNRATRVFPAAPMPAPIGILAVDLKRRFNPTVAISVASLMRTVAWPG